MKTFKSRADVARACLPDDLHTLIAGAVEALLHAYARGNPPYDPKHAGYVVLIEPGDDGAVLAEIGLPYSLAQAPWEGVERAGRYFYAIYLANNEFGLGVFIPDAPWLSAESRHNLEENLIE